MSALHNWMLSHPIACQIILGPCFGLVLLIASLFVKELRAFLVTPPQKLRLWILKARLYRTERRYRELVRRHKDFRYFVRFCLLRVFWILLCGFESIWLMQITLADETTRRIIAGQHPGTLPGHADFLTLIWTLLIVGGASFMMGVGIALGIQASYAVSDVLDFPKHEAKLHAKIVKLSQSLQRRDAIILAEQLNSQTQ